MAYKRVIHEFENVIEVEEFYDGRYGAPGQKRAKKKKPTKEEIERVNQWNKEKKARHRLRKYFKENDWFITLTYPRGQRPSDMDTVKKHFREFYKAVGKEYKKRGYELRWIRNIECGPGGNWHIHVVLNQIPDADIIFNKAWKHGRAPHKQRLYEKGDFKKLSQYITKSEKSEKKYVEEGILDHKVEESNYSTSRNMPLPEPKVEHLVRWAKEPRARKGFYIDKNTAFSGINRFTGYPYRHYEMIRIERRDKSEGRDIHRHRRKVDETEEDALRSNRCSKGKNRGRGTNCR